MIEPKLTPSPSAESRESDPSPNLWPYGIIAEICQHHREKIGDAALSEAVTIRLFFHSLKGWFSERQREQAGMLDESFLTWLTDGQLVEGVLSEARARGAAAIPHAAHMVWLRNITDRIREHYRAKLGDQRLSKPAVSKLLFHEIVG